MKKKGDGIPLPDVELNDVTDYYAMYVTIGGVSEDVFWNCDIGFVKTVAENKLAYDKWINRQREQRQRSKRKK